MSNESFHPPSLAQLFEAPEGYRGSFGWICGYSADADFLNDALERFTRLNKAQRAYDGKIAVALMLDPGNSQITLENAPGVWHLGISNIINKPFVLLHAKTAILGFLNEREEERWLLRLIVSTGNWTCETLEKSIDLAWCIEISSEDLVNVNDTISQHCADISAAWDLMQWIGKFYNQQTLLPGRSGSEISNFVKVTESWINSASSKAGHSKPRFIDNREKSLCSHLPEMISAGKRNYLGMGSGFFESSSDNSIPSVLKEIVAILQNKQLLVSQPEIDVFVNPSACQAVAASLQALSNSGYTVRDAGQPSVVFKNSLPRSLHAKFIFSANYRTNSKSCNNAWLYLGSGNLTGPGFSYRMSSSGGNLEVGVVFTPECLYWKSEKWLSPEQVVSNVLPVQWDTDVIKQSIQLTAGEGMPERLDLFIAPPVAWLVWSTQNGSGYLKVPDGASELFEVLGQDDRPCPTDADGNFIWKWRRPRYVYLRWQNNGNTLTSFVPILDEYGRFAATDLPLIDLEEVWWQLANFPTPPTDEELPPEDGPIIISDDPPGPPDHNSPVLGISSATPEALYPVRKMMQLIENIAAKQTAILKMDWTTWCTRLEQCLIQASDSPVITSFKELEINPLSPLWKAPFRPLFAESAESPEGMRYEAVLRKVELAWNVTSLNNIGEGL